MRFALAVYLVNFALLLGFCILHQYWSAVLAGSGNVLLAILLLGGFRSLGDFSGYSAQTGAAHDL